VGEGTEALWTNRDSEFQCGGVSLMQAAFDQANRAVRELITGVIRPEFFSCNPEQD
jgi:hypothetical protein